MGEVIVITSGKGGVGKTTTTANLGSALALAGKKVALVDTDIGLRNLDVVLGLENRIVYDLCDVIEEKCKLRQALIKDKRFKELFLLPAAQTKDKTAINEEQMRKLCEDLKLEFDYVIIIQHHYENMMNNLLNLGVNRKKIIVWKKVEKIEKIDQRIAYLHMCADLIKERNIRGSCAEVGVYKGDFAKYINCYMPERKLYLFDTFEGFGMQQVLDIDRVKESAFSSFRDTSVEEVLEKMTNPQNCIIRKGCFPDTAKEVDDKFAFVSLDADLYEPIKSGLEFFYPRLEKGGYIFVHDYGGYDWPGVKCAVNEFCYKHKVSMVPILDRCLSVIITK